MKDNKSIRYVVIFFIIFTIAFPMILKIEYKGLSYSEWYGILASFIGGSIGGITTLIALYVSTNETRRIQSEDKRFFIESQNKEKKEKMKTAAFIIYYDIKSYLKCLQQHLLDYCNYKINYSHLIEPTVDEVINDKMDIRKTHKIMDKWMEQIIYIKDGLTGHSEEIKKIIDICSICEKSSMIIDKNDNIGKTLELLLHDIFSNKFIDIWKDAVYNAYGYSHYPSSSVQEKINEFKKYTYRENEQLYVRDSIIEVLDFLEKLFDN